LSKAGKGGNHDQLGTQVMRIRHECSRQTFHEAGGRKEPERGGLKRCLGSAKDRVLTKRQGKTRSRIDGAVMRKKTTQRWGLDSWGRYRWEGGTEEISRK